MSWLQDARLYAWYKLRRQTRKARNKRARQTFADAVARLKPGDVCIDCGANVGAITRQLAATGATVHAFEPDPDAFAALTRNTEGQTNIVRHNAAVGAGAGTVTLYRGKRSSKDASKVSEGSSLIADKKNLGAEETADVEKIDFGSFVSALGKPVAIIKIDIEGAEVELLENFLDRGLQASAGHIFVETHEKQIPELRERTMRLVQRCRSMPNVHLDWW